MFLTASYLGPIQPRREMTKRGKIQILKNFSRKTWKLQRPGNYIKRLIFLSLCLEIWTPSPHYTCPHQSSSVDPFPPLWVCTLRDDWPMPCLAWPGGRLFVAMEVFKFFFVSVFATPLLVSPIFLWLLRDVWIRTQRAAVKIIRRANNLATHLPIPT